MYLQKGKSQVQRIKKTEGNTNGFVCAMPMHKDQRTATWGDKDPGWQAVR